MPTHSSEPTAADILTRNTELAAHLQSLGLESVEEYMSWCAHHGFGTRIEKDWRQRCKERYFAAHDEIQDRLSRKRLEKRKPHCVIARILDGELAEADLTQPHLSLIHRTVAAIDNQPTRDAIHRLLLAVVGQTGLLSTRTAFPQFGTSDDNTLIGGLIALARHHESWIRPPKMWNARSRSVRRQFSSLARHLLAEYPVPQFMDSVWFLSRSADAARRQAWFKRLAAGESPRSLELPISLTKRMAHYFLRAPKDYSLDEALRFGQITGLGGNRRLANAILGSRIAVNFDNNDFWQTVVRWLIDHPWLDPAQIAPLIDYIHHRKFEPQSLDVGDTELAVRYSDFRMKGRTPASLIQDMREWHGRLRRRPEASQVEWVPSGTGPFDWSEGVLASNNLRRWTIVELLSGKELCHEGQVMRHCVASYDDLCARGGTSIWSLGVERNLGHRKRVLTIELANHSKKICQARGKANRRPTQKEMSIVGRWASQEKLTIGKYLRA